ncbi:MAG: gliding motility-associated C-terminal domain-containing protein, partial [Bacteroidales bacterium]|nr:gliding motility-associated C-terminal domain-containing protein [Bacteroidales bacterium]
KRQTVYRVTGTDANNCTNTAQVTVTVNALPVVTASASPNPICQGQQTTLSGGGAVSYTWNQGLGSGQSHQVSPNTTTVYSVTGTDNNGCTNTAQVTVIVDPPIQASISGDTSLCIGETTILNAMGGTSYQWSGPGITNPAANPQTVTPSSTGQYTVTVTQGSCSATATIWVNVHPLPVANAGNDTTIVLGNSVQLQASGGVVYQWSPATGLSCTTCPNPVASPSATTLYTVTVTNEYGCSSTDDVLVKVELNCGDVFVPQAFSPNGDGNNDVFKVHGNCIETIQVKIFDRWGNKIFETTDPNQSWNGEFNGKEVNGGTYTYVVTGTLVTGESFVKKGVVVLIK